MNNLYYMGLYGGDEYYRATCSQDLLLNRKESRFYSDNEGFVKGNIEKDIYHPYKNYNPRLPLASNDKERLLLEIQKLGFYLVDLGLYLDLHPTDKDALMSFNETKSKYYRLINEYNKNYCPLMFIDSNGVDKYQWIEGTFPWQGGN